MASEFFLNITAGLINVQGMSAEQSLTVLTVFFSVGVAIYFSIILRDHNIGVATFFFMLIIGVFLELISIIVVAIPLILTTLFYFYKGKSE